MHGKRRKLGNQAMNKNDGANQKVGFKVKTSKKHTLDLVEEPSNVKEGLESEAKGSLRREIRKIAW